MSEQKDNETKAEAKVDGKDDGKDEAKRTKVKRTIVGRVVSDKMDQTVSVAIDRLIKHPVYGKYIRRTTKVLAHDAAGRCRNTSPGPSSTSSNAPQTGNRKGTQS